MAFHWLYGKPKTFKRIKSWNLLQSLNHKFQTPWLCVGDFNELIRSDEKLGGNRRSHTQMQLFKEEVDAYGFMDLGYSGSKYTWSKHFANGRLIWERLDRAFCTNEWLQLFAGTKAHHLTCTTFDHIPIWIVPDDLEPPPISRPFHF